MKKLIVFFIVCFVLISITCDAGVYERRKRHNLQLQKHLQTFQRTDTKNGYNSRAYQNFNMRPRKHFWRMRDK
jgi:hypothetical protein